MSYIKCYEYQSNVNPSMNSIPIISKILKIVIMELHI